MVRSMGASSSSPLSSRRGTAVAVMMSALRAVPQSGSEAFLALLEALQLGAQNEAAALLSGELSGLTDAQLKDFFGPYQSVRPHPFRPDVAGAVPPGERRVRAFSFAASDASGAWQVTNAQEL